MFVRIMRTCFIAAAFCLMSVNVQAAQPPGEPPQAGLLRVGDRINILVDGEEDLSGFYVINKAGEVDIPLIGKVMVAGKTPHEAKTIIVQKLQDGYLNHPDVSIEGKPQEPPPAMRSEKPDTKPCNKKPRNNKHAKRPPEDHTKRPLPPVMADAGHMMPPPGMPLLQHKHKRGVKHVYIVGAVNNPGYYVLPPEAGHILNAIALAGGYAEKADTENFEIVRNIDGAYYRKTAQTGALEYHDGDIVIIGKR